MGPGFLNVKTARPGEADAIASTGARVAGYSGLLSVAAGTAGLVVDQMWRFPGTAANEAELMEFATEQRTPLLVAMLLNTLAVTLWLMFGAGVWVHIRRRAGETIGSACFGLGLVSFVTLLLAGFTAFFVLVYRAPAERDPLLLYDVTFALLAMSGAPTAVSLTAFAFEVARSRMLPGSTVWFAALGAITHVLLFASLIVREGFWSLQGPVIIAIPATLFAWIAATSIALLRDPGRAAEPREGASG